MVVLGLIGARVLYVWENFKFFSGQLIHAFYITEGGISQWGRLVRRHPRRLTVWARRGIFSFWKVIDAGGPAAMIGLAIAVLATSSTASITARRPRFRGVSST